MTLFFFLTVCKDKSESNQSEVAKDVAQDQIRKGFVILKQNPKPIADTQAFTPDAKWIQSMERISIL